MIQLYLAPMHEINCLSFRLLCKKYEADVLYTPMINVKAYLNNPENFKWLGKEKPLVVQLIGSDSSDFKECVKLIKNCDYIDLNAGCPSTDNIKNGSGAALIKNLDNFKEIIKTMAKYSNIPVSVKIRLGWRKDESLKIARIAEECGAERLAVHARLFGSNYSIPANWDAIKKIKSAIKIPVIANGDIDSFDKVKECQKITNADGLMIGREAMRNPFVFKDIKNGFKNKEIINHSKEDRIKLILEFIRLYKKNEIYSNAELKNHCIWLSNGFNGAAAMRNNLGKCKDEKEIISIIKEIKK
ncbi:MAG: tRNA-dihydrouridine synthase family protein [Candidatus Nanoarchaeia archaeon]|nr:tRNA-dihydrouridine synthase family protein [Candidatus Nanoarchaeia archaeon]